MSKDEKSPSWLNGDLNKDIDTFLTLQKTAKNPISVEELNKHTVHSAILTLMSRGPK